jgi:hypothetical protein
MASSKRFLARDQPDGADQPPPSKPLLLLGGAAFMTASMAAAFRRSPHLMPQSITQSILVSSRMVSSL